MTDQWLLGLAPLYTNSRLSIHTGSAPIEVRLNILSIRLRLVVLQRSALPICGRYSEVEVSKCGSDLESVRFSIYDSMSFVYYFLHSFWICLSSVEGEPGGSARERAVILEIMLEHGVLKARKGLERRAPSAEGNIGCRCAERFSSLPPPPVFG